MIENNMVEDSALENVSGGAKMNGYHFSGRMSPASCAVGKNYYVVNFEDWYYGKLEEMILVNPGEYRFRFETTIHNGVRMNMTLKVNSVLVEIYSGMTMD